MGNGKKYGFAAAISQRTDTFAERQQLVSVGMVFLLSTGRNLALENIRMFCFLPDIVKAQTETQWDHKGCRNRFRRSNCERGFYHESVDWSGRMHWLRPVRNNLSSRFSHGWGRPCRSLYRSGPCRGNGCCNRSPWQLSGFGHSYRRINLHCTGEKAERLDFCIE